MIPLCSNSTFTPIPKPTRKKRDFKRLAIKESVPLEEDEQEAVADWLDLHKVFYTATMAGCFLHPATYNRMKRMGLKRGVPDLLILDPPPAYTKYGFIGVALELKRKKGGVLSEEQSVWMGKMSDRHWYCVVAEGADKAIEFLESCGYGGKK